MAKSLPREEALGQMKQSRIFSEDGLKDRKTELEKQRKKQGPKW